MGDMGIVLFILQKIPFHAPIPGAGVPKDVSPSPAITPLSWEVLTSSGISARRGAFYLM
jgi:hypothetical protein